MKIISVNLGAVEYEDDSGYRASVFLQGDGRLKCHSSRCKSRNHFTCEHVRFVQSQNVTFSNLSPLSEDELRDLIDE